MHRSPERHNDRGRQSGDAGMPDILPITAIIPEILGE